MTHVIGHRGAAAYAPENTLASFEAARRLGCQEIEFDVMLSQDDEPFIFHDENLKRTTNGRGEFGQVSADYLRSLDAGSWYSKQFRDQRIPSLQEAILWLNETGMRANIEIKPYPNRTEATSMAVLSQIHHYWPADKALPLVSSFDREALIFCRKFAPEMPLGLLLDRWNDDALAWAADLQCFSVNLSRRIAKASRIAALKKEGYKVYVYTINRKRQALKFFALGVDAIFSDYPDLLGPLDKTSLPSE